MRRAMSIASAIALSIGLLTAAGAHQVWIEQDAKTAKFYFGEYEDNLREVSPGLLDKLAPPVATLLSPKGERLLKAEKTSDTFVLNGRAENNKSLVAESLYPVYENKANPQKPVRTAWTPAARFITGFGALPPRLIFDLVPTGTAGEFQLFFKGKPLPKTKLLVMSFFGWGRESWTNEEGRVRFSFPWKGHYLISANYNDPVSGERDGEKYDVASYSIGLSFVQTEGLAPLPALPAAKPNS